MIEWFEDLQGDGLPSSWSARVQGRLEVGRINATLRRQTWSAAVYRGDFNDAAEYPIDQLKRAKEWVEANACIPAGCR